MHGLLPLVAGEQAWPEPAGQQVQVGEEDEPEETVEQAAECVAGPVLSFHDAREGHQQDDGDHYSSDKRDQDGVRGAANLKGQEEEKSEYRDCIGDVSGGKAIARCDALQRMDAVAGRARPVNPVAESERGNRRGSRGHEYDDSVEPAAQQEQEGGDHRQRDRRGHRPVQRADRLQTLRQHAPVQQGALRIDFEAGVAGKRSRVLTCGGSKYQQQDEKDELTSKEQDVTWPAAGVEFVHANSAHDGLVSRYPISAILRPSKVWSVKYGGSVVSVSATTWYLKWLTISGVRRSI